MEQSQAQGASPLPAGKSPRPAPARQYSAPAWLLGLCAAVAVLIVGAASLSVASVQGHNALESGLQERMTMLANAAAQLVDPEAHAALTRPNQLNGRKYNEVVAPLRSLQKAIPQLPYIYTVRSSPEGPRFGVDAADPGDSDRDGVEDQSGLTELYEDPDDALLAALADGTTHVSSKPYTDKWGTFVSAFAPVRHPDGSLECVVGVDMTAKAYMARRAMMNTGIWLGGALTVIGATLLGLAVFRLESRRRRGEAAVHTLVQRQQRIASQLTGMIYQFRLAADGTTSIPYASEKMTDLFGVDPAIVTADASPVFAVIVDEDVPGITASIRESARTLEPCRNEFRVRRSWDTGEVRWLRSDATPQREPGGTVLWHGFVSDVTEEKQSDLLRAEALVLSNALSTASSIDEAARAVSNTLARTTGLSRCAVLLFDDHAACRFVAWRGITKEYRSAVDGHCPWTRGQADASPIIVNDALADASLAAYHPLFERERVRSLAFIPISSDGGVVGKLMLYGDAPGKMTADCISAGQSAAVSLGLTLGRLLAGAALARSEQRIRTVIDTALDAVVAMDSAGNVTEWNAQAEKTFGWTRDEAVGKAMHDLIIPAEPPTLRQMHVAGLARFVSTGEARVLGRRIEVPALRKDGTVITVELAITAVRTDDSISFSAFLRDVTERKRAEAALRESERTTRLLAEHTHDLVGLSSAEGAPLYLSPSVCRTLGYTHDELSSENWAKRVHPDDRDALTQAHEANLRGETTTVRHRALPRDGRTLWLERTATPVLSADGSNVEHIVWSSRDVTAQVEAERAMEAMALTDRLTGLPNSALLHDRLRGAMDRFRRDPSRAYAVLFLDFDRFKLVNDTLGHDTGDALLRQIATRLRRSLRTHDTLSRVADGPTVSRLGGDEFVVVLDCLSSPEQAATVADRLIAVLADRYDVAGQSIASTASIGLVLGDARYERPEELLRDADTAMYEAKAAGRGRWMFFDEAMRTRVLRRAALERDLALAGERGELRVHYQPIVSLETGACSGLEALARWKHPTYGDVSPAEFIPIAEESDLIMEIGAWVFGRACGDLAQWRSQGRVSKDVYVAINLSRRQLTSASLGDRLAAITRDAGLSPQQVCVEITETAVMRDKESGVRVLTDLKRQGFRLSLDDFGTGQSSLASLRELPLDAVKIDRSFIASLSEGRHNAAMLQALADLAHNLGMNLVAEGVETTDQVAALQAIGCGFVQGYFFGRPMPAEQVPEAIKAPRRNAA